MSSTELFRQSIIASILIAGRQPVDIASHGGNRAKGSHITATFGSQLMITMLDRDGALAFANTWTNPGNRWVFNTLPPTAPEPVCSTGPSIIVRAYGAYGADEGRVWVDRGCAVVRIGALTWLIRDRAAADSMVQAWQDIAELAPVVLGAARELRKARTR
jgi:hypothetical protein